MTFLKQTLVSPFLSCKKSVRILNTSMSILHQKLYQMIKKLAHTVVIESSQNALLDGYLYHFYQPRVKGLPAAQRLVRQLALPGPFRLDVLRSFHDSYA